MPKTTENELRDQFIQVFRYLDGDKDDFLSAFEVDRAVVDPSLTKQQASVVAVLKTEFSNIAALNKDGPFALQSAISLRDLVKLIALLNATDLEKNTPQAKMQDRARDLMECVDYLSTRSVSLYNNNSVASKSIRPDAVVQGRIGNCSFMAALASVAAVSPTTIARSITNNLNDTYTVTFRGAQDTPFVVPLPTLAERAIYARDSKLGCWPAVLEKAYGCYLRSTSFSPKLIDAENTGGSQYWREIFALLTGQHGRLVTIEQEQSRLHEILDKAFKDNRAVCAWSIDSTDDVTGDAKIPSSHVFSVISWSAAKKLLTFYNPWGGVPGSEPADDNGGVLDGRLDGVFSLTLEQLRANFDYLHVEEWSDGATLIQEQKPEEIAKNDQSRKLSRIIRVPVSLAVLCFALAGAACLTELSWVQATAGAWPQTIAEIYIPGQTLSAPTEANSALPYFKEFEYRYTVNGKAYSGSDSASLADLIYEADELANARQGQKIKVSYNPQNPAESKLRPGFHLITAWTWFIAMLMAFGLAFFALMLLVLSLVDPSGTTRHRRNHNNINADFFTFKPLMQRWIPAKWRARILNALKLIA